MKVKFLKLITGEIISATILHETEDLYEVRDALVFNYNIGTFTPYDELFEEEEFFIEKKHCMRSKELEKENAEKYFEAVEYYKNEREQAKSQIHTMDKKIITPNK